MTEPPNRRDFYHLATMLMLDAIMDADTADCAEVDPWDQISQYTLDECARALGGARDAG